jgi:hypothetical protein
MRRFYLALGLALSALAPAAAEGCGDKFLRVGRGARFQRGYVSLHPSRILLYARPNTQSARALRELEPALKRAGHNTLLVSEPAKLDLALRGGKQDVVIADFSEAPKLAEQVHALPSPPSILPVISQPTPEANKKAQAQFGCYVESPGKKLDVLAEIDGLLERRLKERGSSAAPTGSPAKKP